MTEFLIDNVGGALRLRNDTKSIRFATIDGTTTDELLDALCIWAEQRRTPTLGLIGQGAKLLADE